MSDDRLDEAFHSADPDVRRQGRPRDEPSSSGDPADTDRRCAVGLGLAGAPRSDFSCCAIERERRTHRFAPRPPRRDRQHRPPQRGDRSPRDGGPRAGAQVRRRVGCRGRRCPEIPRGGDGQDARPSHDRSFGTVGAGIRRERGGCGGRSPGLHRWRPRGGSSQGAPLDATPVSSYFDSRRAYPTGYEADLDRARTGGG